MSLDNIELTPFLIQELFKNCLVEMETTVKAKKIAPASSFNILGNNRAAITIIVENATHLHLPDPELNFLLGILSACKLTMEDVAIINISKNKNATYKTIELELKAGKIILFGVTAAQIGLPLEFPIYQVQHYNQQTYIAAGNLQQIESNKADKTKLWNCLKQIFTA